MFNTAEKYGLISILLHWIMAFAIIGLFAIGWYMVDLTYYDSLYKTLPEIHKSVGILVAILLIIRIIWSQFDAKPEPENSNSHFIQIAAATTHICLLSLTAIILFSGYLISTAEGAAIAVFDIFEVPATVTSISEQEDRAGFIHKYLAYAIFGLTLLHAVAALKHHFYSRDNTLRKILGLRMVDTGEQ